MTIKNKKTKQSSEVTSSSSASTSVQKTSKSTSVQQSSNTLQKVSSGKKVRYIDVKVEEDDPLMITDVSDHTSIAGSTVSEHYNSHPHYIITEAPSMSDLSQMRSQELQVSDMTQSTTGEFVSSSVQESSTSQQTSSKSESFQATSSSVQRSGSSHSTQSQSFDKSVDSSTSNQTLNTAFIDSSARNVTDSRNTFSTRSQTANASNNFLQTERQNLVRQTAEGVRSVSQSNVDEQQGLGRENVTYRNSPDPSQRIQTVRSDSSNFYGGEGSLDRNVKSKEYTSTSKTSESKSSNVTKSSSSSYVVEIVDGKERIIDSSKREWGDAQEHATNESYASVSGTDIKPQSAYSVKNYDMKSKYDTGKEGQKPTSELTVKEDSKYIKDGKHITTHASIVSEKDNLRHQQSTSTQDQLTSSDDPRHPKLTTSSNVYTNSDNIYDQKNTNINQQTLYSDQNMTTNQREDYTTNTTNYNTKNVYTDQRNVYSDKSHTDTVEDVRNSKQIVTDRKRNVNQTDSSNFYGYDTTIQNELRKVGDILQVKDTDNINFFYQNT